MEKWIIIGVVAGVISAIFAGLMFFLAVGGGNNEGIDGKQTPSPSPLPKTSTHANPTIGGGNQPLWIGQNPRINVSFLERNWCGIQSSWGKRITRSNGELFMQSFIYRGKNNIEELRGQKEVMRLRVDEGRVYNGAGNYDFNEIWFPSNENTIQIGKTGYYRNCDQCRDAVGAEIQEFGYAICEAK